MQRPGTGQRTVSTVETISANRMPSALAMNCTDALLMDPSWLCPMETSVTTLSTEHAAHSARNIPSICRK